MKSIYKISVLIFLTTMLASCSDDDGTMELSGTGIVKIEFDNSVSGDDLILGSSYTNSQNESLTIERLNYIVSNFRLTDKDGNVFTYPKEAGYFITSEENGETEVVLMDVPAGRYTSLTFGIGVDQEKYLLGAEGQGDLLTKAESTNMMWSWQAGYKFLNFEGTFTSSTVTEATNFKIHMGSHGSSLDNYKETTLSLGSEAIVSEEMSPIIHLVANAGNILDGQNKISLSEQAVIMVSEEKSPKIAINTSGMFTVDHIHNGSGDAH
ncbi:MbnP family protein [Flagellimonas marinaquae]|uniref:MbnP family protein n=1 Tax=Flagellimonas marinaquae TaxID=254955 RepID=UPI000F8E193B|nr:MbnP family protein [Allomuricauda aquimarina]